MDYRKLLKNIILLSAMLFVLCCLAVFVIDPFFHYHKPVLGLKAVLNEKEYQCIGTIRNFDYDALIVGSSVCENYNNGWINEKFDVNSIKAIRSYGATADLCYFIDEAYANHDIKKIFYNIDPGSLAGMPQLTFESTGCPMYLYDHNAFNDIEYLLNKDVLFSRIPYMISKSYIGNYDEGDSYNWGQWKEFNSDMVLGLYIRKHSISTMKAKDYYKEECQANIDLLTDIVEAHPETEFYFFVPPYSFVWWDNIYRYGDTDAYINNLKMCASKLLEYNNVRFYYFLDDEDIVTNLENYMDVLHFSPDINYEIVLRLSEPQNELKISDLDNVFDYSKIFADRCVNELIVPYEDILLVQPEDED